MKIGSYYLHALCLLAAAQLFSCSRLPEYARPQFSPQAYSPETKADSFTYRKLTMQDFKASSPPTSSIEQNSHIQARSCINIRPSSGIQVNITNSSINGEVFYMGSISEVDFEARFLPHCSWWNPKVPDKKKAYVLQHEQVHFAIAELEARELTQKAGVEIREYVAFGDTRDEVKKSLSEKLQGIAVKSTRENLEEHLSFDKDTSMVFEPEVQAKWLKGIESRINDTSPQK